MTTQSHLYKQDDDMKLPSCCEFHGMPDGCRQGDDCPAGRVDLRAIATRRVQEAELRWNCRDQMSARQLYEHARAGEFAVGEEGADAPRVTGTVPPIVTAELRPVRDPWTFGEVALVVAVVWLCGSLVYLRVWG